MSDTEQQQDTQAVPPGEPVQQNYEEFEIGEHEVPWFLWVFFTFVILWASIAWIPFFSAGGRGY